MSGLPGFSRTFIGGAISSAASPLQTSFTDCRSPVTARRPSRHYDRNHRPKNLSIDTDKARYSLSVSTARFIPVTSTSIRSGDDFSTGIEALEAEDVGSRSSAAILSTTRSSHLVPRTPQLFPSTNGSYIDPDQGKLGTFSAINIIIGKTVGVGVYSVPSSIFVGVGSVGMSILMWVLGAIISYCG